MFLRRSTALLFAAAAALSVAGCGKSTVGPEKQQAAVAKVAPPAGQQWHQVVNPTTDGGFVMGNPEAPIKLVEYGALTCSHCRDFANSATEELHRDYVDTGQVAYEYRIFLLHQVDGIAGAVISCAGKDRFYPLMENIYAEWDAFIDGPSKVTQQPDIANVPDNRKFVVLGKAFGLDKFFASRGVSQQQFDQCLANPKNVTAIQDRANKGTDEFNITGTPTFVLNGSVIDVPEAEKWPGVRNYLRSAGAR